MKEKAIKIYTHYSNVVPMELENRKELILKCSLLLTREIIEGYEFDLINLIQVDGIGKDEDGRIMNRINFWDEVETQIIKIHNELD